jgi:flagellar biosynthesis protein FlhG
MSGEQGPVRIAVGGGKGGVGKSLVAANLAVAVARLGFRTVLVDADLGAANQHTLFGLDRPGATLQSFVDREVASLEEVASPTGAPRLFLVPGVGAIPGAANLAHAQKLKILRHLARLDTDVVVIDVGAGVSFNVLDFFAMGDHRLVVTTPQLPSMQNAYCFLKAAVHRLLRKEIENHAQREAFEEAVARSETDRIRDLRRRAEELGAGLDPAFERVTGGFEGRIVGNMLEGPSQRKVLTALARMSRDFLDVEATVGPCLPLSRVLHESVTRRRPFAIGQPGHEATRALEQLAESLLVVDVEAIRRARRAPPPRPRERAAPTRAGGSDRLGDGLVDYLRREDRVEVRHAARVAFGGRLVRARVRDLSPRGALVEGDLGAEVGDVFELALVGFPESRRLRGVVRHVAVDGRRYGVELEPSARAVARWLLEHAPRRTSTLPPHASARSAAG